MKRLSFLFFPLVFLAMTDAQAGDPAACAQIVETEARLTCYDAIFSPATTAQSNGKWQISRDTSPIDDSPIVIAYLMTEEPVLNSFGLEKRPLLLVRCRENTTSVIFSMDGFFWKVATSQFVLTPQMQRRNG